MRVLASASVIVLVCTAPRVASADEGEEASVDFHPAAPPAAPAKAPAAPAKNNPVTRDRWYGWQGLLVDGGSILLATPVLPPLGVGGYFLGAPIVHAAHGHWWTAAGSLGLRVGLPVLGAVVASGGPNESCREFCIAPLIGGAVGVLAAIAVDAAALSWETVPVDDEERERKEAVAARARRGPVRVAPGIAPRREGGVDVGITGVF